MPTYDYKCNACGHRMEMYQSMKDAPRRKCPHCGKLALERLIGAGSAVIFKGSGFYQTDYRSDSYKKGAEAEKPAATTEGKGESKPETKAETKAEAKPAGGESKKAVSESKPAPKPESGGKEKKSKAKA